MHISRGQSVVRREACLYSCNYAQQPERILHSNICTSRRSFGIRFGFGSGGISLDSFPRRLRPARLMMSFLLVTSFLQRPTTASRLLLLFRASTLFVSSVLVLLSLGLLLLGVGLLHPLPPRFGRRANDLRLGPCFFPGPGQLERDEDPPLEGSLRRSVPSDLVRLSCWFSPVGRGPRRSAGQLRITFETAVAGYRGLRRRRRRHQHRVTSHRRPPATSPERAARRGDDSRRVSVHDADRRRRPVERSPREPPSGLSAGLLVTHVLSGRREQQPTARGVRQKTRVVQTAACAASTSSPKYPW